MRLMAGNGAGVLAPVALLSWWLSRDAVLGPEFYGLQAVEWIAGALNVALIGLNLRDGLRMARDRALRGVASASLRS